MAVTVNTSGTPMTAAEWASNNPTLRFGELARDSDTGRIKLGDGSSAWSSLPYVDSGTVADQNANLVYAGPSSGAAATPDFRALVSADLPAHGLLTVNTTASTVSNTVTETNFTPNHVITGGTVAVGQVYRLRAWGVYGTDALSSSTQRFRVKAGSTVLGDSTAKNNGLNLTNRGWQIDCYIVVTATGAGGNAECQGTCGMSTSATATGFCDMENTAVVSLDWTADQTFQVSVEHSAADTDITATMRMFIFERIL